ncbi:SDR family NAD(P)-dependent oxidoreductase [Rhizobium sp. CFBP 8762]|uniref:SDR family NAD(P)-dependent oxidoreductase n=1 Tax=Rhizobium sp. CFBP 8762 TaxID=2775279 RepID=UPI00177D8AF4|nr:SDR family NAD(P)-dependent oxidoreductase [Rhizobium sp. CFBP 8762]MBD8555094.1 SDR family NAD(P)-dependent oxidoreductase [Rhizobium sp. CFBP 8762]
MTTSTKTWFITGASRGFGHLWAKAALERGDKVAATARNTAALGPLVERFGDSILPISLDVTDRNAVFEAVAKAHQHFSRLDVVLSNAGYGHQGAVEEITEPEARAQIDTNLFGTMFVAQAALPFLRKQKSGHIIAVSSVLGVFSLPNFGIYNASKFAVEGLLDALSQEVAQLGIKVTLIEPAGYATDFNDPSSAKTSEPNPAYQGVRDGLAAAFANYVMGKPEATPSAILKLVDSDTPPLRLALGASAVGDITGAYQGRLATWESWRDVSEKAQG